MVQPIQPEEMKVRVLEPCDHMINAVNGMADGSLKGPMRVFTRLHTLHCKKCRTALQSLTAIHTRLGDIDTPPGSTEPAGLTTDRSDNLEAAFDRIEGKRQ